MKNTGIKYCLGFLLSVGVFTGCSLGVLNKNDIKDYKMNSVAEQMPIDGNEHDRVEIVVRDSTALRHKRYVVFFDFDKANLTSSAQRELDLVKRTKSEGGRIVEIKGYTDVVGSDEYNEKLSRQRAQAVAEYLGATDANIYSLGKTEAVNKNCTKSDKKCGQIDRKSVIEYIY